MMNIKGPKRYGLILTKKSKKAPLGLPNKLSKVFNVDDDDTVIPLQKRDLTKGQQRNRMLRQKGVEQQRAKALAEDPSIFQYDEHVDNFHQQRKQKETEKQKEKEERKSKYISGMLDRSKIREIENDIIYEKQLAKERDKEEYIFADKKDEKYITGAYKEKLKERDSFLAFRKLEDDEEKRNDVTKKDSLFDIHKHVLNSRESAYQQKAHGKSDTKVKPEFENALKLEPDSKPLKLEPDSKPLKLEPDSKPLKLEERSEHSQSEESHKSSISSSSHHHSRSPRAPTSKSRRPRKHARSPDNERRRMRDRSSSHSPVSKRDRSSIPKRARSPIPKRARSPISKRARSPISKRARSPISKRARSPISKRARSPISKRARSPISKRARSPISRRARSPVSRRSRSPVSRGRRSPISKRGRSRSHSPDKSDGKRSVEDPKFGEKRPQKKLKRAVKSTKDIAALKERFKNRRQVRAELPQSDS